MINSTEMDTNIRSAAKTLWNYLRLDNILVKSDVIIAMGSHDIRVAEHATNLLLYDWAPLLVFSGGLGRLTAGSWKRPEAEVFAEAAMDQGAPAERILVENLSSNTGENIIFTKNLLQIKRISVRKAILVHKPYMERRSFATAKNYWPDVSFSTSSPPLPFDNYPNEKISMDEMIHIMVGDCQRIMLYPELGYQIPQAIPENVTAAYQNLIEAGYTNQLVQPVP